MKRRLILSVSILMLALSCGQNKQEQEKQKGTNAVPPISITPGKVGYESIKNTLGVVKLVRADKEQQPEAFKLINHDGSIWAEFDLEMDNSDCSAYRLMNREDFSPRIAKFDYYALDFTCVDQNETSYTVVVNEQTKETKRILKSPYLELQDWDCHIQHGCIIGFDDDNNILRDKPNGEELSFDKEEPYIEVQQVKGEWLKVSIDDTEGWMRWRDGDTLLATTYYLM